MTSVVLVEYDAAWPAQFAELAELARQALGDLVLQVEHVGSTAIPGLVAKPIIDLDVVVRAEDVREAIWKLETVGYQHKGDQGIAGREAFRAPEGSVPHHLYVCPVGNTALTEHLQFRDALRADRELAQKYGQLKRELAMRFPNDRARYCEAKTEFVYCVLGHHKLQSYRSAEVAE